MLTKTRDTKFRMGSTLGWLWGSWIVMTLIKAIQHQTNPLHEAPELALMLAVFHTVVVAVIFLSIGNLKLGAILLGAHLARFSTLLLDLLATFDVPFMASGGDADGFYQAATIVSSDISLAGETYGGSYTGLLGVFFYLIGPDRLMGQYLNVMLGLSTLILLAGILRQLNIGTKATVAVLTLAAFMPMLVIHSSVLLRETIIQVLVTAALFSFIKGLFDLRLRWTILSILFALLASVFHSGVVGVVIGFAIASAFIYKHEGNFRFGIKRTAPILLMALTAMSILLQYPELFLGKFQTLESANDLLEQGLSGRGGSAYLTGLEVNNWLTFIAYAPIRAFYFIASPFPWDWRGVGDVVSFGLDSIIYLAILLLFFSHKIKDPNRRYIALAIAFVLLVTSLVFGVGVSNAGTALRHRTKLIAIFLVLLAIILDSIHSKASKDKAQNKEPARCYRA